MRYGSREVMDVVLKDVATGEPKVYLESLHTSTLEFTGSTVFARGGKGHPKLIGWDSEKNITMNMEDALISKESLAVLTGSNFKKAAKVVHKKEVVTVAEGMKVNLAQVPLASQKNFFYKTTDGITMEEKISFTIPSSQADKTLDLTAVTGVAVGNKLIVDYYYTAPISTQSMSVTSDLFPGTYTLEGTTFWRNEDGVDVEALYTIPKLKVQPGFSIAMTSTGDPQPFKFTADILKDRRSTAMVIIDILE